MSNTLTIRMIVDGMLRHAKDHHGWFPGLDSMGRRETTPIPAMPQEFGTACVDGYEPVYRMAVLMRGGYFPAEAAVSHVESNYNKTPPVVGQNMTTENFSFAMLRLSDEAAVGRRSEWRDTGSARAVVMSDRNLGSDTARQNIHTSPGDGWRGSIVYNDNHGEFTQSTDVKVATSYALTAGTGETDPRATTTRDDLFADDNDDDGRAGNDAAMVYQDGRTYVNQK